MPSHRPSNRLLTPFARLFWLGVNGLLGALPSFLFFCWVERGGALPLLPNELGWPWITIGEGSLSMMALWNISLFLFFGFLHSVFAQHAVHARLRRLIPPQAIRSFYLAVTGGSLFLLMALWQHTGRIVWALPLGANALLAISLALFWTCLILCGVLVGRLDLLHFIGLRQLYQRASDVDRPGGAPRLLQDGIYGWVRHPVYTLTLAAFLLTPVMTLDRLLLGGAMLAYLSLGIPIEERKLIATFGPAYEKYRRKVPALFPVRFPLPR